jgi:hypothetical protein
MVILHPPRSSGTRSARDVTVQEPRRPSTLIAAASGMVTMRSPCPWAVRSDAEISLRVAFRDASTPLPASVRDLFLPEWRDERPTTPDVVGRRRRVERVVVVEHRFEAPDQERGVP